MQGSAVLFVLALAGAAFAQSSNCIPALFENTPFFTDGELDGYYYSDFNVISFGNFANWPDGGDVEGRLAVRGDVYLGQGFTIGNELETGGANPRDASRTYSFVQGGNYLCWNAGGLMPDGTNVPYPGAAEYFFSGIRQPYVLNNPCLPLYLRERQRAGDHCAQGNDGCLNEEFDTMQAYYRGLADTWAGSTDGAVVLQLPGPGLRIEVTTTSPEVVVHINNSNWNAAVYRTVVDIDFNTQYLIIVIENDNDQPTVFTNGKLPGGHSRIAFVFNGTGPEVRLEGGVTGSIVAPDRAYNQTHGVSEMGFIIAGDIPYLHQANRPHCDIAARPDQVQKAAAKHGKGKKGKVLKKHKVPKVDQELDV